MNNTTLTPQSSKPAEMPKDWVKIHRKMCRDEIKANQDDPEFLEMIREHLPEGTTLESLRDEMDE
jgi:hypothetical protein